MRIVLFTGKGGVGKTTAAAATALRLADRGVKTLVISTDAAHSLADALGTGLSAEPTEVCAGLHAVQVDTRRRFEAAWHEVQGYLRGLLDQGGLDPITAEELTMLPGIDEVLALLAVRDLVQAGSWDAVVLDCAPTAETLRLLALPEALGWYLQRVFPVHRALARGVRPLAAVLGQRSVVPPEAAFDAMVRLAEELNSVRVLLADPEVTSVRLVLTPESVVAAEARRTFTALALYGYRVDEVVANRVFPAAEGPDGAGDEVSSPASRWQRDWVAAQRAELDGLADSFAGLPVRELSYLSAEPVGARRLRAVAEELYGELPGTDPIEDRPAEPLLSVAAVAGADGPEFVLTLALPLIEIGEIEASRSGDELIVTVPGHRRVLSLPSVLRRCQVTGGSVTGGRLELRFVPDPVLWPA